ncbi:MAG: hypothetical protein AB7Q97_04460 [Gammaproteobacteria bacterium]
MIRGPSSALCGSSAGGVISLFTEDGPEKPFIQAGISGGEDRFQKYTLKGGGQAGKLNDMVSAAYLNFGGYRAHASWPMAATRASFPSTSSARWSACCGARWTG